MISVHICVMLPNGQKRRATRSRKLSSEQFDARKQQRRIVQRWQVQRRRVVIADHCRCLGGATSGERVISEKREEVGVGPQHAAHMVDFLIREPGDLMRVLVDDGLRRVVLHLHAGMGID